MRSGFIGLVMATLLLLTGCSSGADSASAPSTPAASTSASAAAAKPVESAACRRHAQKWVNTLTKLLNGGNVRDAYRTVKHLDTTSAAIAALCSGAVRTPYGRSIADLTCATLLALRAHGSAVSDEKCPASRKKALNAVYKDSSDISDAIAATK